MIGVWILFLGFVFTRCCAFVLKLVNGITNTFVWCCRAHSPLPSLGACHELGTFGRLKRGVQRPSGVILVLFFLLNCRIGEACNPGPHESDCRFTLGCFNPTGLPGKAEIIQSNLSHGDLWAVTETHLSSRALHKFQADLRFANSPFRCVGGHPAPPRTGSTTSGSWTGVAIMPKQL